MTQMFQMTVKLACSAADACDYFSRNSLLESWLGAVAHVEPRVGGAYELFWDPTDRESNSTIGCRITAFVPGQLISFDWRSPKQFKSFANTADPLTHVVVAFCPEGTGTALHIIHSGWRSTPEWVEARIWQERAWRGALKALESLVNGAKS